MPALHRSSNGDTVAGRKVELIVKDDTGSRPRRPSASRRNWSSRTRCNVLAGFGLTPLALAAAPVATEAKVPMIVMAAATSIIPTRSPYIVRSGFTLPQVTAPIADWAAKNEHQARRDAGHRLRSRASTPRRPSSSASPTAAAPSSSRCARRCAVPDYAPFLQRVKDAKPDALFVFVPSGRGHRGHEAVRRARAGRRPASR